MSTRTNGRVHKYLRKQKFKKSEVLRVLAAVMEKQASSSGEEKSSDYHNEFFNTGRIGRRNALPDILGYNCTTTTSDLPARLSTLTTKDNSNNNQNPGTSTTGSGTNLDHRNEPSTSQSCTSTTQQMDDMNT